MIKLLVLSLLLVRGSGFLLAPAPSIIERTELRSASDGVISDHRDNIAAPCHAISRRHLFFTSAMIVAASKTFPTQPVNAIGPIKVEMRPTKYTAKPCPPSKPIPGQQAMRGMRGLCVTVDADLIDATPKDLEKVGVYGFVRDGESGDSVLANNPDLNTDSGQFTMIELIKTTDKKIQFEFIAAVPKDRDLSKYENGIGPLIFESLRVVSYPGGQQFGAISPVSLQEVYRSTDISLNSSNFP
jgi:hypothetical protein